MQPRLNLEELEDRCTPAMFMWNPWIPSSGLFTTPEVQEYRWSDARNWLERNEDGGWLQTLDTPGDNPQRLDDVEFRGSLTMRPRNRWDDGVRNLNKRCWVDESRTINSVLIDNGYTAAITLTQISSPYALSTLTIAGTTATSSFLLKSEASVHGGTIQIAGTAFFLWQAGYLALKGDATAGGVRIGPQARMDIRGEASSFRGMDSCSITVQGTLNWQAGDVFLHKYSESSSQINISSGRKFNITAEGSFLRGLVQTGWGGLFQSWVGLFQPGGEQPEKSPLLIIRNHGELKVNTPGTATFEANYTTTGTTTLESGVLSIAGSAEQSVVAGGPISEFRLLNNATVALPSPTRVLGIRDGNIIGNGTVQGNLVLGNDPNAPDWTPALGATVPIISPGSAVNDPANRIGLITVTESFQMFSGAMHIDFFTTLDVRLSAHADLREPRSNNGRLGPHRLRDAMMELIVAC